MTDPRLLLPTFQKCELAEPPAEEVKRYRAYLTRVSKWLAFKKSNDDGLIRSSVLRGMLVSGGEVSAYLDDGWAKRVFGDKEFFEDAGDGFWKVRAEEPSEPSSWEGVRPGEDVLGTALARVANMIGRRSNDLSLRSRFLDDDGWEQVHRDMLSCLEQTKARGVERPLNELQERALREACLDPDLTVQAVAYWLLNTRQLVDVMQRLISALRNEGGVYQPYELEFWGPQSIRLRVADGGGFETVSEEVTPQRTLEHIRRILLNRGILGGKKQ